jgi:hypothetical protein
MRPSKINSPCKPAGQAIKKRWEGEREEAIFFIQPCASESVRIKQLPKGKQGRASIKKKVGDEGATCASTMNIPRTSESSEARARSDLAARFDPKFGETSRIGDPIPKCAGIPGTRRIGHGVGEEALGSDQSNKNSDRNGPKQHGKQNPCTDMGSRTGALAPEPRNPQEFPRNQHAGLTSPPATRARLRSPSDHCRADARPPRSPFTTFRRICSLLLNP